MQNDKNQCFYHAGKYCACIEFQLSEHRRRGFHTSQLIEYSLEPNPDAEDDRNAPAEKLLITFSTADVVILGWRLHRISVVLRENDLASVHALPKRYGEYDGAQPYVSSITVTPITKHQASN